MNNWAVFCWTVGQRCANLKLIDLCSAHWHDGLKDLMFLLKEKHDIKLSFTAFKAKDNHPRLFKYDFIMSFKFHLCTGYPVHRA